MKKIFLAVLLISFTVLMVGCDRFKGDQGTPGTPGLIETKTYTGTPTSNPYPVNCPEITDLSKQVVDVYMTAPNEILPLPFTGGAEIHGYDFYPNPQTIYFATSYTNTDPATFPATALKMFSDGYQASYRIDIKTFASAASQSAFLQAKEKAETQGGIREYFNIDLGKVFSINR